MERMGYPMVKSKEHDDVPYLIHKKKTVTSGQSFFTH